MPQLVYAIVHLEGRNDDPEKSTYLVLTFFCQTGNGKIKIQIVDLHRGKAVLRENLRRKLRNFGEKTKQAISY